MAEYDFTEITSIIAARENILDYKLEHQYSTNKGDGYSGSVCSVKIKGSNKELNVAFKYSHRDVKVHDLVPLHQIYIAEIDFYEKIGEAFKEYQSKFNIPKPFDNIPKYYAAIRKPFDECIAMENLKCLNYDLWDRKREMNQAHLEMALTAFAKFHGTSMAMKHLHPEQFAKIIPDKVNDTVQLDFLKDCGIFKQIDQTITSMKKFEQLSGKIYQDKLEYFRVNLEDILSPPAKYHDEYDAIIQGDCWCNNAMYCYKDLNDRSVPVNIKLLDWQCTRLGSVVNDLSYFFYSIAPKESIANLDYFLKLYHDTFSQHLEGFGLKINEVFPFEVLLDHWKKNAKFGLMFSFMVRKVVLVESEDAPDMDDGIDGFLTNIQISGDKLNTYNNQMINILKHFVDRDLLC